MWIRKVLQKLLPQASLLLGELPSLFEILHRSIVQFPNEWFCSPRPPEKQVSCIVCPRFRHSPQIFIHTLLHIFIKPHHISVLRLDLSLVRKGTKKVVRSLVFCQKYTVGKILDRKCPPQPPFGKSEKFTWIWLSLPLPLPL